MNEIEHQEIFKKSNVLIESIDYVLEQIAEVHKKKQVGKLERLK